MTYDVQQFQGAWLTFCKDQLTIAKDWQLYDQFRGGHIFFLLYVSNYHPMSVRGKDDVQKMYFQDLVMPIKSCSDAIRDFLICKQCSTN